MECNLSKLFANAEGNMNKAVTTAFVAGLATAGAVIAAVCLVADTVRELSKDDEAELITGTYEEEVE